MYGFTDSISTSQDLSTEIANKQDNKSLEVSNSKGNPSDAEENSVTFKPSATNITIWIFMSWSFFLILISIPFYFNHKRIKERQSIIKNLIEKGHEIPKELLTRPSVPGRSDFHKGVILISLGLSVAIVLWSLEIKNNFWTIGLIPFLIGIAYLISFKLDKAKNDI
jgi:cadmium resistance protein CadD (predicted permease)